jgi:hypothetical protein
MRQLEAGTHQPRRATLEVVRRCLESAGSLTKTAEEWACASARPKRGSKPNREALVNKAVSTRLQDNASRIFIVARHPYADRLEGAHVGVDPVGHPFDRACREHEIEHRLTKHPWSTDVIDSVFLQDLSYFPLAHG